MVAIQVRDVPDDVREVLVREAERRDQSLQAYLMDVLTREADSAKNLYLLAGWKVEAPIRTGTQADIPALIRQGRREREQQTRTALRLGNDVELHG